MRPTIALAGATLLSACFLGPEDNTATRQQIIAAAERCGIEDFEPTRAGAGWAAYVPADVEDGQAKQDCIYADLRGQGLIVTR